MTNAANAVVDVLGEALLPKQTIINIPPPPHTPGGGGGGGQLPNNALSADATKTLRINANASGKNVSYVLHPRTSDAFPKGQQWPQYDTLRLAPNFDKVFGALMHYSNNFIGFVSAPTNRDPDSGSIFLLSRRVSFQLTLSFHITKLNWNDSDR